MRTKSGQNGQKSKRGQIPKKIKVLFETMDRELNFALNIESRSTLVAVSAHA